MIDNTGKLSAKEWRVQPTSFIAAKLLTERFHYMKTINRGAVYIHGLFDLTRPYPFGVAVWLPAVKGSVDRWGKGDYSGSLMLHRLVIAPDMPCNAASFLLGRSIRLIKQEGRFSFLITYADTYRNHTGGIYKATNWQYRGTAKGKCIYKLPDGSITTEDVRGTPKRPHELLALGAEKLGYFKKHVFTMELKKKEVPVSPQLSMF